MVRTGGVAHRQSEESLIGAVGRYLFGPPPADGPDRTAVMSEIERLGGLVAPADVMRVTGLDRPAAESLLCRLAARHGGDVAVAGEAVVYRFPVRRRRRRAAAAIWSERREPEPLTGNDRAVDLALLCFNLALLVVSATIILLTISASSWAPAIALVPFQLAVLALSQPVARFFNRRAHLARVSAENGRRALLQAVLERPAGTALTAYDLSHVWICAAGRAITPHQLADELSAYGGEPDVDDHARLQFRFPDLDHESRALAALRA